VAVKAHSSNDTGEYPPRGYEISASLGDMSGEDVVVSLYSKDVVALDLDGSHRLSVHREGWRCLAVLLVFFVKIKYISIL
jgi:hypothetical protein